MNSLVVGLLSVYKIFKENPLGGGFFSIFIVFEICSFIELYVNGPLLLSVLAPPNPI
jgi:hypothetical protein